MTYVKDDSVYEYDQCEECKLYGDDEYINSDGELNVLKIRIIMMMDII